MEIARKLREIFGDETDLLNTFNQDAALQHVKSGKLRALAVTSKQRNPMYPDVPTIAESGYPAFEALSWSGLSTPKGTPQVIVDKLEAALGAAMSSPVIPNIPPIFSAVADPDAVSGVTTVK